MLLKHHSYPADAVLLGPFTPQPLFSSSTQLLSRLGTADSTANLLDDVDGNAGGEASVCGTLCPRRSEARTPFFLCLCAEEDGQAGRAKPQGAKEQGAEPGSW